MERKKVLVALSGGVDSAVSAVLLKEQGYDLIGVTLRVYKSDYFRVDPLQQNIKDAAFLAHQLDIPYYVIDVFEEFEKTIVSDFVNDYKSGRTPNPCTVCNQQIKWKSLLKLANEFNCEYIATGHYVQINNVNNRFYISKGIDDIKDQSYFLWRLNQEELKRTIFPLGNYRKDEIKQLAAKKGFNKLSVKKESYAICFIPEGDYRSFILNHGGAGSKPNKGEVVLKTGEIVGEHSGIENYTIGQRYELNVGEKHSLYVIEINHAENKIILGVKNDLLKQELLLESYNLTKYTKLNPDINMYSKIRYKSPEIKSNIIRRDNQLIVCFNEPVSAIAPGQSIVFYEGTDLIGGGVIAK